MTRNKSFSLCLIFLFFFLFHSTGKKIESREFDSMAMESYAEDDAFNYMNYQAKPPSIWERLSWWFQRLLERIFSDPNTPWLTRIVYYLILILVVGAAIFYILKLRYGNALVPDHQSHVSIGKSLENQAATDFDLLISNALKEANFRLAIRYLYLKSLVSLSKKGVITLRDSKSPYDYASELGGDAMTYKELARTFEYIWYGDFEAKKEHFERAKQLSQELEDMR